MNDRDRAVDLTQMCPTNYKTDISKFLFSFKHDYFVFSKPLHPHEQKFSFQPDYVLSHHD